MHVTLIAYLHFKSFLYKKIKDDYVARKLNEWKVDMFSKNSYLSIIPQEQTYNKQLELKKEYLEANK